MPTLQVATYETDSFVNGVNLSLPSGLPVAPVMRSPYIPGARLSNASDSEVIEAALYNLSDLDTEIMPLTFLNAPTWQDLLNEPGAASLSLDRADPALAFFAMDGTDVVYFFYRGVRAFEMIPNRIREVIVATAEEPNEVTIFQGLGALGALAKGIIFPTGGAGRSPIEEDRHFGWHTRDFDHSGWVDGCAILGTAQHLMEIYAFILSVPVEDIEQQMQQSLPTLDFPLGGPSNGLSDFNGNSPVGDWYFYDDETTNTGLNIPETAEYVLYAVCDDECQVFLDGQEVVTIGGINAFGVGSAVVSLSAGAHSIGARITNLDLPIVTNRTHFGFLITTASQTASFVYPNPDTIQIMAYTSGFARVLAYPPTVPGQTVTKTFRLALEESQARGKLLNVVLDFTDSNFSDGAAAPLIPDIGTKVGTDLLTFARELAATYVDIAADISGSPAAIRISMWAKDTRGVTRDIAFQRAHGPESTGNLTEFERETELILIDDALVRWDGGWTLLDAADSTYSAEAPLEIGAPASLEEVQRMAQAAVNDVNLPRSEITAGLEPRNADEAPYTGFTVGDVILETPLGAGRVSGITFSEDTQTGNTIIKITIGDLLLSTQARVALEIQKFT